MTCGLLLLALTGCANSNRSALAVCKVLNTDGVALHNHYEQLANSTNSSNVLASLAAVAGAPGRLADLVSKLEAVAPPDIEPAFKTLANSYRDMGENEAKGALDPVGGLISGLTLSFNAQGANEEVNAYLTKHCGRPQ